MNTQKIITANTIITSGHIFLSVYSKEGDWPDASSQRVAPNQGTDMSGMNTTADYKAVSMLQYLKMESSKITKVCYPEIWVHGRTKKSIMLVIQRLFACSM